MKIEILNERENPLLKRKEFEVKITHDAATPGISEIRKKIAASENIGKGTIIIDSFKSKYGSRETVGTVKVYQTKDRALEIEPRHRLIKNGLIEVTEEKPKEAKPTEKEETEDEKKPEGEDKPDKKEVKKKDTKPEKGEVTAEKEAAGRPEEKKKKGKEKPKEKPDKKKGE